MDEYIGWFSAMRRRKVVHTGDPPKPGCLCSLRSLDELWERHAHLGQEDVELHWPQYSRGGFNGLPRVPAVAVRSGSPQRKALHLAKDIWEQL